MTASCGLFSSGLTRGCRKRPPLQAARARQRYLAADHSGTVEVCRHQPGTNLAPVTAAPALSASVRTGRTAVGEEGWAIN